MQYFLTFSICLQTFCFWESAQTTKQIMNRKKSNRNNKYLFGYFFHLKCIFQVECSVCKFTESCEANVKSVGRFFARLLYLVFTSRYK